MEFDDKIDLTEALETCRNKHGREGVDRLCDWVDGDVGRFAQVWAIMRDGEFRDAATAAWLVDHSLRRWPELLVPLQFEAYEIVKKDYPDAVHRALMNQLRTIDLDPDLEMPLFDLCIAHIGNRRSPVAIRCHAIFLGWKIAEPYEELHGELGQMIEMNLPTASAGFKNRGNKVLRWIENLETRSR